MKDFEMGLKYLRKEALASGFIEDSDNDDVLVQRLAGVLQGKKSESGSNKKSK